MTSVIFFQVDSQEMIERVFKLQDDLGFDIVIVSGMEAYKVADELSERNIPVLASIDFPEKPDWQKDSEGEEEEEAEEQEEITEEEQAFRDKRWEAFQKRYKNIRTLMDAGVDVGFATAGMELSDMGSRLKEWMEYGDVETEEMIRIMTLNTAEILNQTQMLGEVENGNIANFTIMSKPFMEEDAKVLYTISEGQLNEFND